MRLVLLSLGIVIAFGIGAWGIAAVLPEGTPAWFGVTVVMAWLFLLILMVSLISSKDRRRIQDQRRLLGYGLLAAVLMASFLVPLFVYNARVPKWAAEAVLAAIAGVVFLLSKYMERRKFQHTPR